MTAEAFFPAKTAKSKVVLIVSKSMREGLTGTIIKFATLAARSAVSVECGGVSIYKRSTPILFAFSIIDLKFIA